MDVTALRLEEEHWRRLERARARLLLLDHDGTIAPFVVRREEARAPAGVLDALGRIGRETETRVVIVSGRPVAELARLVAPLDCELVGEHGWEWRAATGVTRVYTLPDAAASSLERAEKALLAAGLADAIERKRTAVVLHVRSLPPDDAERAMEIARSAWSDLRAGVRVTPIDGGIEVRALGHDKGDAVMRLATNGELPVYAGDDATDEDAFAAIDALGGIAILVARAPRPSRAMTRHESPAAVERFVLEWAERLRPAVTAEGPE